MSILTPSFRRRGLSTIAPTATTATIARLGQLFLLALLPLSGVDGGEAVSDYNAGVGLYRDGEYDQAAERFRAASNADDTILAAKARYNLGNTHYARAVAALREADSSSNSVAVEHLQSAIQQYESSLRLDPSDGDARINRQLARRLIELVQQREQEKQQEQQPDQGQPDQEKQDPKQQEDSAGDQQSQQQGTGQQDQEQQQEGQQEGQQQDSPREDQQNQNGPNGGEQNAGDQEQDSETPGEQTGSTPQPSDQPKESSDDGSKQNESDNDSARQSDQQQSRQNKPGVQQSAQPVPPEDQLAEAEQQNSENLTGELKPAGETSEATAGSSGNPMPVEPTNQDQMSNQEAEKLLQLIRDRDMLRRMRQQAIRRSRQVPVPRDW